jgi:membrane-associated protease RseP (regulator of RpoE activity)
MGPVEVETVAQGEPTTETSNARTPPRSAPEGTPPASNARSNLWALARLLLGLAGIVVLFVALGGGDLLIVITAIIIMVMVHELGHFATAKWSKMKVTEYFVGFGPKLWSIRRGETDYGVKPILAGGYVKIPGMTNLEEIDPADEPRTYRQKPFHNRIIVASAGSFMHFVMAFVLAWIAVVAFGIPSNKGLTINGFVTWTGHAENAAQLGGLRFGDQVVGVNGKPVAVETVHGKVTDTLTAAINDSPGRPVHLVVVRDGKRVQLTVTPALGHSYPDGTEAVGKVAGEKGKATPVGLIGISTVPVTTSEGPVRALGTSAVDVGRVTSATFAGLGTVFSPHGISNLFSDVTNAQAGAKATNNGTRVESIVGAVRTATQAEQAGVLSLIEVLIALNIVIGIVNMLPMLPLDGGHVAIAVYERIRTKKGQPYYVADAAKLLPVAYAFVAILLVIVGSAVYLDIAHPMANPFH